MKLPIHRRLCKLCKEPITGRADKIFCSVKCKSTYAHKLNATNNYATGRIDTILHRNRTILLELLGKNKTQKKVSRDLLDKKKFHFSYITHYHINSQNKMVHYVYEFSWLVFSNQEVLIRRK